MILRSSGLFIHKPILRTTCILMVVFHLLTFGGFLLCDVTFIALGKLVPVNARVRAPLSLFHFAITSFRFHSHPITMSATS